MAAFRLDPDRSALRFRTSVREGHDEPRHVPLAGWAPMNAPTDNNTNARLAQSGLASPETTATTLGSSPAAVAARLAAAQIAQNPPTGAPDVGAMVRRLFAHWQVIIVCMIIGALVTGQIVKTRVATYKSETVIFYREGIGKNVTGPSEGAAEALRTLGTKLKETLLAQQTLRKIIDEFHLYTDIIEKTGYADAVDAMRKKTEFKSRSQDTFAISYEGPDKDTAQLVCARMAEILISENAKRLIDDNRGTTEFLEIEKRRADEELERTERDISEFLMAHPEFASAKEALGVQTILAEKKAEARAAQLRRAAQGTGGGRRREAPQQQFPGGPPVAPTDRAPAVDPVLLAAQAAASTELLAARKDFDDKSNRLTDEHPDVKGARSRVAAAEAGMGRAQEAVTAATQAAAQKVEPAPRKIGKTGDDPYAEAAPDAGARPAAAGAPAAAPAGEKVRPPKPRDHDSDNKAVSLEIEWSRLSRALGNVRSRQYDMDSKLYKTEMVSSTVESGYGSTIAVLDPAYKPSAPSNAPNKTVAMMGLGASLAVGVVLSAAWGLFLDDRVFGAGEIEVIVMVPVLGAVPRRVTKQKKGKAKKEKEKAASAPTVSQGGARG